MKKILLLIGSFFLSLTSWADEGMWLPHLLQTLNEKDMKKRGMKINAADIYSINKGSLKDAIVSFGGFCTAEVISEQGLLLTNHHCGFDAVQNHSSLENNYILNGFWAYQQGQELPNPGLTATFIIRIEDVSKDVLKGVRSSMTEAERQQLIEKNMTAIKTTFKKEATEDLLIRSFFEGNKYYLFVTETFRDVRLVGAPPSSIGNFGKDTDNWMWPRHTGDFSLFRIYADKNNKPAAYSPDNVPYTPKRSLKISLKGMKEGDFTMVFGFPGRTNEYLPSAAVKQIMEVNDPVKIGIRETALKIMDQYMRGNMGIRIKYAAKYASVENAYKKWKGEVLGLQSRNALGKKAAYEKEFMRRVKMSPKWMSDYGVVLQEMENLYAELEPFAKSRDVYNEIMPRIELFNIASILNNLIKTGSNDQEAFIKARNEAKSKIKDILLEFDASVDQSLFMAMMKRYENDQSQEFTSKGFKEMVAAAGGMEPLASSLFKNTVYISPDSIDVLLSIENMQLFMEKTRRDPAMQLYLALSNHYNEKITPTLQKILPRINQLQRTYMQAQMDVFAEKKFYPDANSTLRLTYGNVKSYKPKDAVEYGFYTYMEGLMEKYTPGDYEFDLPGKLIELYKKKDFGRYGVNGRQPVCFIAANHTTGGNSGSPALDGNGNLVGLNFDRVWEGTMSDMNYDPEICRNVMVDIRYVLFIIDKFAEAKNIIQEIKTVQ